MTLTDRIDVNPRVMLGKRVIRGTRIPVELILRKLSEGASEADLLDAYPQLARNFHRGGKGPGVYYLSDTQLGALIPPAEKQRWEKMSADWKLVRNKDARSEAYREMETAFRPSHADYTYQAKYGIRNWQGGGRASARETIGRVAAAAIGRRRASLRRRSRRSDRLSDLTTGSSAAYREASTLRSPPRSCTKR